MKTLVVFDVHGSGDFVHIDQTAMFINGPINLYMFDSFLADLKTQAEFAQEMHRTGERSLAIELWTNSDDYLSLIHI